MNDNKSCFLFSRTLTISFACCFRIKITTLWQLEFYIICKIQIRLHWYLNSLNIFLIIINSQCLLTDKKRIASQLSYQTFILLDGKYSSFLSAITWHWILLIRCKNPKQSIYQFPVFVKYNIQNTVHQFNHSNLNYLCENNW